MGHVISKDGIKADPDKIKAITDIQTPQSKTDVKRFTGMMQYLSKFCPLLSETMRPLREISNESSEFKWEQPQQDAFNKCKQLATEAPTLEHFDTNKPIVLQVDASDFGLGCVLLQDGKPVFYHSCTMKEREKPMAQIEKECLAICNTYQV